MTIAAPPASAPPPTTPPPPEGRVSVAEQRYRKRRARWEDKYQRAVELRGQNFSLRKIARELHLDRDTVRRWLQGGGVPERIPRRRYRSPDAWADYLAARWQSGCHNATTLCQEIAAQGFKGSYPSVRRFVASWRSSLPIDAQARQRLPKISAKVVSWWLLLPTADLTVEQQKFSDAFRKECPKADQAATLAQEFSEVIRERSVTNLHAWFNRVFGTENMAEMQRFAKGLREDLAAVEAALQLAYSVDAAQGVSDYGTIQVKGELLWQTAT